MSTLDAQHAGQSFPLPTIPTQSTKPEQGQSVIGGAHSGSPIVGIMAIDIEHTVTPRELELLAFYASGYSLEEIGRIKFLSPYTVRNVMKQGMKRSGARNLTHLCSLISAQSLIRLNTKNIFEPANQDLRIAGE